MKPKKNLLLLIILITVNLNLFAWSSSNEGILYTMETLCLLSDSISYNQSDQIYEVNCNIIILENDTLKILPGETVKFISIPGSPQTFRNRIKIYSDFHVAKT